MSSQNTCHISFEPWGIYNGKQVLLFTLKNNHGAFVQVSNYGATLVSIFAPDRQGDLENVVLGYPILRGYVSDSCYAGSTIGRFANRIANARFCIDGTVYALDKNDGDHSNHGGYCGLNTKVFDAVIEEDSVTFSCNSCDGEGGYPGNLMVDVKYSWNDDHALSIQYTAQSDKTTVLNLTSHAYFNLKPGRQDILNHRLSISSSRFLETNSEHIPTGKIVTECGKVFQGKEIHEHVTFENGVVRGVNTYFIFDRNAHDLTQAVCKLSEDSSGRVLDVYTTYPGLQLYTGDFLTGTQPNHRSSFNKPFDGLCLECQYYPDSPSHKHFPSTEIIPGQVYQEKIIYKFSAS